VNTVNQIIENVVTAQPHLHLTILAVESPNHQGIVISDVGGLTRPASNW